MRLVTVATCALNQWAMDIQGNTERVITSILEAKSKGARLRLGPELELSGYGCEDHFLEPDLVTHCWEALALVIDSGACEDIICDIGMPVLHKSVLYNCRVLVTGTRVLLIRPKLYLCDDGNYREGRHFTRWSKLNKTESFFLPEKVARGTRGQKHCPIGDAVLQVGDIRIASETCEELFTPRSPHIQYSLADVHIITNGSGSHHTLRKLDKRLGLICGAVSRCGGVYMYSNLKGCDGSRVVYDGVPIVAMNNDLLVQGSQFTDLDEVEVVTATVDIDQVITYRSSTQSRNLQADASDSLETVHVEFSLVRSDYSAETSPTTPISANILDPMEEIARGPAIWLWDYLRRSSGNGFLIPLSGGADSAAVLAICGNMCKIVVQNIKMGDRAVLSEARRIAQKDDEWVPQSANELANCLLHTCYMSTESNSAKTRGLAKSLAEEVGSFHLSLPIDTIVTSLVNLFSSLTGKVPRFESRGGTRTEDLALQNIQARLRMVISYMMAQLLPWTRGKTNSWLLVLSTANVDEALRGYMTKYDCSSGDLNPIGAISKTDLKKFLQWASTKLQYPTLEEIGKAKPSAELRPTEDGEEQVDETEMGMTYEELSIFGRLRKLSKCGPVSMFEVLLRRWSHLNPEIVATKVSVDSIIAFLLLLENAPN